MLAMVSLAHAQSRPQLAKGIEECQERLIYGRLNKRSFDEALMNSPKLQKIKELFESRSLEEQARIDERLTQAHAAREMTFQVKNPKTGIYDRFVDVKSNAHVAFIEEADLKRLADSTAPVMHAKRSLLQKIYSQRERTIESLGLSHIPRSEADLMLKVINTSIYLEPKLISPVMKDYPFLPVSAFDGAIIDPIHPKPDFFETNDGTPSGLSNNKMLRQELAEADPELDALLKPLEAADDTYLNLRQAIESAALAWTGNSQGISVAISTATWVAKKTQDFVDSITERQDGANDICDIRNLRYTSSFTSLPAEPAARGSAGARAGRPSRSVSASCESRFPRCGDRMDRGRRRRRYHVAGPGRGSFPPACRC